MGWVLFASGIPQVIPDLLKSIRRLDIHLENGGRQEMAANSSLRYENPSFKGIERSCLLLAIVGLICLGGGCGSSDTAGGGGGATGSGKAKGSKEKWDRLVVSNFETDTTWKRQTPRGAGATVSPTSQNTNRGGGATSTPGSVTDDNDSSTVDQDSAAGNQNANSIDDSADSNRLGVSGSEVQDESVRPNSIDLPFPPVSGEAIEFVGALQGFDIDQVSLELIDLGSNLPMGVAWALRPAQSRSNCSGSSYEVWLVKTDDESASGEETATDRADDNDERPAENSDTVDPEILTAPVASIDVTNVIEFSWGTSATTPYLGQLRNCVLEIKDGTERHAIQLRSPKQNSDVGLTFEKSFQYLPLSIDDLPDEDQFVIQWIGAENDDDEIQFSIEPSDGEASWNDDLKIDVSVFEGLSFQLSGTRRDQIPQLRLSYQYLRDRDKEPFSIEQVNDALKKAKISLATSSQKMAAAQNAMQQIPGEIRKLERASIPNGAGKGEFLFERQKRLEALNRDLRNAQALASRLSTSIPKTQALLEGLTELGTVGERLRGKTKLAFAVGLRTPDGQFFPLEIWGKPEDQGSAF